MRDSQAARFYEMMVIAAPEGSAEELLAVSDRVGEHISAAGGSIIRANHESPWGRRRLAYPIRHASQDLRDGFYTLYHFQLDPSRIPEVERELRLDERVIRHLLLLLPGEPVFPEPEEAEEGAADEGAAVAEARAIAPDADSVEEVDTVPAEQIEPPDGEAVMDDVGESLADATDEVVAQAEALTAEEDLEEEVDRNVR